MLTINEIYQSLSGEGGLNGYRCSIVRFSKCNLRCNFCDSQFAYKDGNEIDVNKIVSKVDSHKTKLCLLTGGEPLLQDKLLIFDLINKLLTKTDIIKILIETNGSIVLPKELLNNRNVIFVCDYKLPSSGMMDKMIEENLTKLRNEDELKFVIGDENDYEIAKQKLTKTKAQVLFSPVFGKIEYRWLWEKIVEDRLDVRFQLQLHKIVYPPDKRGV